MVCPFVSPSSDQGTRSAKGRRSRCRGTTIDEQGLVYRVLDETVTTATGVAQLPELA